MWWKKLLYSILAIVFCIGVTALTLVSSFQGAFDEIVSKANSECDYQTLNSLFYFVSSKENNKYDSTLFDGQTIVEVQPVLVKQPHYVFNSTSQEYDVKYETVEVAYGFSLFKLTESFDLSNEGKTGRIELTLSDSSTYAIRFNNEGVESDQPNYHINFVSYLEKYLFLGVYITESDFEGKANPIGYSIYDDSDTIKFSKTFDQPISFDTSLKTTFGSTCDSFNTASKAYGDYISVENLDAKKAAYAELQNLVSTNSSKYVPLQSTSIAFQSNKLLVKVTLAICLSVIGSVLFGNFIFTFGKKKGIYKVLRNKHLDQNKENKSN